MTRLGFWLIFGALACAAITLLPPMIGEDANDLQFVANTLFCDGDQAVLSVNLSEAALAKGSLGSVLSGYCADSRGGRLGVIPASHFMDWLGLLAVAALIGVLIMGLGVFRRAGRSAVTEAASPTASPQSVSAAKTAQRDAEDQAAARQANKRRAQDARTAAASTVAAAPQQTPDWMLGMPGVGGQPAQPSQTFDFGAPQAAAPQTDLQTQLNMLQLAYESSLIWRSEYDARREALLRAAGVDSANQT